MISATHGRLRVQRLRGETGRTAARSVFDAIRRNKIRNDCSRDNLERRPDVRGTLAVVETKLESWRAGIGTRRQGKSAECDQQALGGDGIGDNDADQRSPEALGPPARVVHSTPTTPAQLLKLPNRKSTFESHNEYKQPSTICPHLRRIEPDLDQTLGFTTCKWSKPFARLTTADTIQLAMNMSTTAKPKFARLSFRPPMSPRHSLWRKVFNGKSPSAFIASSYRFSGSSLFQASTWAPFVADRVAKTLAGLAITDNDHGQQSRWRLFWRELDRALTWTCLRGEHDAINDAGMAPSHLGNRGLKVSSALP